MTNEQAKQEAIKKSYGKHWDLVKKLTPKNGNDDYDLIYNGFFKLSFLKLNSGSHLDFFPTDKFIYNGSGFENAYVIPSKIHGLHQNNGWIRIEPDGSNLPESGLYKVVSSHYSEPLIGKYASGNMTWIPIDTEDRRIITVTHYKPITPEKKPIY